MANSKLIIVEGAQGAGKTTITDYLRYKMPYTNLYRLSGTADQGATGRNKAMGMYLALLDYIKQLENKSVNLLFDRTFFTEEVYCRLGKKDYNFTEEYQILCDKLFDLDFDIYFINLFLSNPEMYDVRLDRPGKAKFKTSAFDGENSYFQQMEYEKMVRELYETYGQKKNVKFYMLDNDRPRENVYNDLNELFKLN